MEEQSADTDTTLPLRECHAVGGRDGRANGSGPVPAIPGYAISRELGRGGMGVVYLARQVRADRAVALKMALGDGPAGTAEAVRFHAEALAVARLQHPNVVAIYDVGEHEGRLFICMEFCPKGSLASSAGAGPLPVQQSVELLLKVAGGVAAAHAAGIVHRDLKPGNVLLSADGEPKVADFGLAKLVGTSAKAPQAELTVTGAVLGTPTYMAPEQAGGAKRVGPAADVYALGVMLYEFLTGHPPFRGRTATDTLLLALTEDPRPPREVCPWVPPDLEAICLRCLEKDPARRYPTAKELAADLAHFLAGEPVSATRSGAVLQLVGAIGRVRLQERFAEYGTLLLALAPVMLLPELWISAVVWHDWPAALLGVGQIGRALALLFLAVLGYFRGWQMWPRGPAERQLWMVWGGYLLTCFVFGFSGRLAMGVFDTAVELKFYQGLACLTALAFFALAPSFWGYCAVIGGAFLVLPFVMAIDVSWAPIEFGGLWAGILVVFGIRLRKLGRQPSGQGPDQETGIEGGTRAPSQARDQAGTARSISRSVVSDAGRTGASGSSDTPVTLARPAAWRYTSHRMAPPPPAPLPLARRLAGYLGFALTSVAILFAGQRLDRADLSAPFHYGGDALLILPMVKSTVETGTHWRNHRLGAPGVQELHDFPVVDHLHLAFIWLMGLAWPDPVAVFNLFHLLTYPLVTVTALLALRHFGLSFPAAGCAAILYAFLPHHYVRGLGHYFLAAYYVVPLTVVPMLWVCQGRLPFFRRGDDGRYRWALWTRDAQAAVVVGLLTSAAGAYYAFFGCALLAFAGLYGWVAHRTWRAFASAGLVTAVVVLGGLAQHLPAFAYQARYGHNSAAHARQPEEAEDYGLKLTHLLLPTAGHNSRFLAAVQSAYDSSFRALQTENRATTLGFVGAAGFLALLAVVALPVPKRWSLGPLAALTIFGTLLGTIGGLGSLFAFLVTPQVRAYDRVAIYLAFFALFASCWLADRLFDRPRLAWLRWPAFLVLTAFGVWDQTNRAWFRPAIADARDEAAARYREDAAFFARVESAMPGGTVFTLPFVAYPETLAVGKLSGYDHARGYLHTATVRWSFGAVKGREADQWQREVAILPPEEMLRRLVLRGFDGLFLNRRGYDPAEAGQLLAGVAKVLGPDAPRLDHPDGQQVVFDLRPFRDRLRQELGDRFDALAAAEADAVRVLWLDGFYSFEKPGEEWKHRWCGPRGVALFVNPTDRPRTVKLDFVARTFTDAAADVRIEGDIWSERMAVNRASPPVERTLVVPPGRHVVRFRAKAPPGELPTDSRRLTFFLGLFRMTQ